MKIKAGLSQCWLCLPLHYTSSSLCLPTLLIYIFWNNNCTQRKIISITTGSSSQPRPLRLPVYSAGAAYFVKHRYISRQTILNAFLGFYPEVTLTPLLLWLGFQKPRIKQCLQHTTRSHLYYKCLIIYMQIRSH